MPDELTTQTETTQADAGSVDATTFADEGSSAPLVQKDNAAPETAEQKKERISQKKWKDMADATRKSEEREAKLKQVLGIKPEDTVDVVEVLAQKMNDLESKAQQKEFEAKVPKVRHEKYAEAWDKIIEAKKHLVQKGELTYEDLWKMIRDEGEYRQQSAAVQETQKEEQEAFSGSVPFFGSSVGAMASDKLSPTDKEIARAMGWTEKNYQAAGVL